MLNRRIFQRDEALNALKDISKKLSHVLFIHYSCESFYEKTTSSRITAIAIRSYSSGQTQIFSIHKEAEIKKISLRDIPNNYDLLEKSMLDKFYSYVTLHLYHCCWIHWNMRDSNYGFLAIAHRYCVLGGSPIDIQENNLYDLARILISLFGENYIQHPRLTKIIELNKISNKDFLSGSEEAKAFEEKNYIALQQSTLRKVDALETILDKTIDGTIKHNAKFIEIYGQRVIGFGMVLKENPVAHVISFLSGLVLGLLGVLKN